MILAILASLILWPLYLAVFIPLAIIGLVILAPLSLCRAWRWRTSKVFPLTASSGYALFGDVSAWWGGWLTWLWGNEENGVTGPSWWMERNGVNILGPYWPCVRATYRWSALRNPVNNLRFVPLLCPVINPARVRHASGDAWTFTWQGVYAGFIWFPVIRGQVYRFWLGWKLKPEDAQGVPDTDMRKPRCGFAIQFKRI